MKRHYRTAIIMLIGVLVGTVFGGFYQRLNSGKKTAVLVRFYQDQADRMFFESLQANVSETVVLLHMFRRGETNALFNALEENLSGDIYVLSIKYPPDVLLSTNGIRTLEMVAQYRNTHPFNTGDEEQDRAVEQLLSKVRKVVKN